jgi:D-alanyl-D-alanine carboxypeptidase/D-alanyl-D-alanine-endopeptidase (penicillin-binding protein 4)
MNDGKPSLFSKIVPVLMVLTALAVGVFLGAVLTKNRKLIPQMALSVTVAQPDASGFVNQYATELLSPALDGVAVSMVVLDEAGDVWFASPLAHTAMIPASALKVLTTGAALSIHGPDFRFTTQFASSVVPDGPLLDGDLVIVGGGDPALSSNQLKGMVDELVKRGIRRIDGRVITDATIFPEHPMSDHWNWGDVGNAYGAGAYGLNVDHNRMVVRFRPGDATGDGAEILGSSAVLPDVEWINRVTTGPRGSGDGVVVYSEPYGRRVTFRGTVPAGVGEFSTRAAIPNPPETAAAIVRAALLEMGVEITGKVRPAAAAGEVLAESKSAPLIDIIRNIHRTSDNLEAQCVFLSLAPQGDPAVVVRDYWRGEAVEFSALRLLDGSGLARANAIRAVDLARVMHAALAAPHGREFFESLPVYQDGVVRSKPGWMSGVTTSVGTITTRDGRRMTYAFMANSAPDPRAVRELRERLRAAVAR